MNKGALYKCELGSNSDWREELACSEIQDCRVKNAASLVTAVHHSLTVRQLYPASVCHRSGYSLNSHVDFFCGLGLGECVGTHILTPQNRAMGLERALAMDPRFLPGVRVEPPHSTLLPSSSSASWRGGDIYATCLKEL